MWRKNKIILHGYTYLYILHKKVIGLMKEEIMKEFAAFRPKSYSCLTDDDDDANKKFNINTIKLSYSCIHIVKNLIKQHNSSIMKSDTSTNERNCRNKDNCPLDRHCLVEYMNEATVSTINQTNTYFGSAEGSFKRRDNNHTLLFGSKGYRQIVIAEL